MSDHPLHLYLSWPSRDAAMAALEGVFGPGVEEWPLSGEFAGMRYSAVEWGTVTDPTAGAIDPETGQPVGEPVSGYHVGLWVHATHEEAALAWQLGATVREEADLQDWWPRLG